MCPFHQGATILASYAWTYESDSSPGVSVSSASDAWLPNGGLPVMEGLSTDAGQGMLPVHDTTGIVAALLSGASTPYTAAGLVSCTSSDGTVTYGYDSLAQLTSATYTDEAFPDETYSYDANGNPEGDGAVVGPDNQLLCAGGADRSAYRPDR